MEEDLLVRGERGKQAVVEAGVTERRSTTMCFEKTGSKVLGIMDLVSM